MVRVWRITVGMGVVLLLLSLTMGVAGADDQEPLPGFQLLTARGQIYLAERWHRPGQIYRVSGRTEVPIFTRPVDQDLTSFSFGKLPRGLRYTPGAYSLVFCNSVEGVWRAMTPTTELLVLPVRDDYVREVNLGPGEVLYFSHARGSAADGRIMKVAGGLTTLYTNVTLLNVDGFWAGHFAFDPSGKLYVSSGNTTRAKIYRYPTDGTTPEVVFREKGPIMGFWFLDDQTFLYTNGTHRVLKGHLGGTNADGVAYQSPNKRRFVDVVVR